MQIYLISNIFYNHTKKKRKEKRNKRSTKKIKQKEKKRKKLTEKSKAKFVHGLKSPITWTNTLIVQSLYVC